MDADAYREESHRRWERVAPGWGERRAQLQAMARPVSQWMVEAIHPQVGHDVLELAAGPGDTGLLAAELVAPVGKLICTDAVEPMLDLARARAAELGIRNVEFRLMEAEWIDLPAASVDAVLCRWGLMLLVDPAAALREARRVLRPGGRLALAAWDAPERNPWTSLPRAALAERGLLPPRDPEEPDMFAFAAPGRIGELLADAGFAEVEVAALDLEQRYADAEDFWAATLALSPTFADALAALDPAERDEVHAALAALAEGFREHDGALVLPARALVAAATA